MADTISRLGALKAQYATGHADHERSSGRLCPLSDFGSNPGALKASYHMPDDSREGRPLVVVLHGCTQNASTYDRHSGWSQLADEAGFALLYPEQQRGNNPNLCFNWFLPGDTQRGAGEVLSISQMIETMVETHRIDRDRIFIVGLSAGGAMAAATLATYPDIFAGGAIIAGLAHGTARTVPEAFDRMRGHGHPSKEDLRSGLSAASNHTGPWPKISIWQGSVDQTVAPLNAETIAAQWRGVHRLDKMPTYSRTVGALEKQVWCDEAGDAVMEINLIAGMGHGTPVGLNLGGPGPFMLDVGISSTRDIAGFWGIAEGEVKGTRTSVQTKITSPVPHPVATPAPKETIELEPAKSASSQRRPISDTHGVQRILEDAFRAAGLMR